MALSVQDWESVFRSSRDMVVLIDADTYNVLQVTNALLAVHSITQEGAIGRPLFDVFPPLPGSDPSSSFESFEKVKSHRSPDVQDRVRFDVSEPDGTVTEHYWISSHFPVLDEGHVKYIMIYADDVTAFIHLSTLASSLGKVGESLRQAVDVILDVKLRTVHNKL